MSIWQLANYLRGFLCWAAFLLISRKFQFQGGGSSKTVAKCELTHVKNTKFIEGQTSNYSLGVTLQRFILRFSAHYGYGMRVYYDDDANKDMEHQLGLWQGRWGRGEELNTDKWYSLTKDCSVVERLQCCRKTAMLLMTNVDCWTVLVSVVSICSYENGKSL